MIGVGENNICALLFYESSCHIIKESSAFASYKTKVDSIFELNPPEINPPQCPGHTDSDRINLECFGKLKMLCLIP